MSVSTPKKPAKRRRLTLDDYERGVLSGDKSLLARAITLVESERPDHQKTAQELLVRLLPRAGNAHRIGITGVPGVGKSTLIETFGKRLTAAGHRVAVLAVDPTSRLSGGSILGDKTRMETLATDPNAFIRPSPSGGQLGGVGRKTRETSIVCEAAGYDVVLVETVGVGQSETVVAGMVDVFMVLMLPGAGDELQGIKRGILELADLIVVNKADGDRKKALLARQEYMAALKYARSPSRHWKPPVATCSGLTGEGLDELWRLILEHRETLEKCGEWEQKRSRQRLEWMWTTVEQRLMTALKNHPDVRNHLKELEELVLQDRLTPTLAAEDILRRFGACQDE